MTLSENILILPSYGKCMRGNCPIADVAMLSHPITTPSEQRTPTKIVKVSL
jgi:hypothetical protein